ncbi:hypothetical protein IHV10_03190 [Fictibacillus sp. 5RED26]|uniref:hypothetical protein n=1 Tax=Fictibacillus sp. 5RED26 TaxID=2745876 RepID=UPI0018CEB79D|nr:hypothetical protein [Fictibacillus sp. 5RED26]MBH0155354.1 hypothetical protein [Fictibacillus sp. 5RED26]
MKHVISCIITVILMLVVNYVVANLLGVTFIDFSLFVGLIFALTIRFFTSKGGISSNMVRMQAQAMTGIKIEEEKATFKPSYPYYTAIIYTLVSLVSIFVYYKDYFI